HEVHALDRETGGRVAAAGRSADGRVGEGRLREPELHAEDDGIGPALDERAKHEYRQRLTELTEELDEANAFNDGERAARAQAEIDLIVDEISGAVGLGGRDRPVGSQAERARVNVTRAIESALRRIGEPSAAPEGPPTARVT